METQSIRKAGTRTKTRATTTTKTIRRVTTKVVGNHIKILSLEQLEALGEALLDFKAIEDLLNWLNWLAAHQTT